VFVHLEEVTVALAERIGAETLYRLREVEINGTCPGADTPPVEDSVPPMLIGLHDVGLSVNPARLMLTSTRRSRSGIPSRICGNGSETTRTRAVVGSTYSAWRTTTVPRS